MTIRFPLVPALLLIVAMTLSACAAPAPTDSGATTGEASTAASLAAPVSEAAAPAVETAAASAAANTGTATTEQKFVYVSPTPIGVNAFLLLGQRGAEEAANKHNATLRVLESTDPTTREENVRAAVNEGATMVIVIGFEFADVIPKVAPESPDTQFLIIDQCIDNPPENVHCAVFREHEAAYLIGVEAGLLTKTNKVGVIGALDIPFLHRYTDAYAAGAKAANPQVETSTLWVGTDPSAFSDPARGKELALSMAAQGNDHIFAAASASNLGIFEAAKEQQFFSFGVDINQCDAAPGFIVDNLLKRVDVVTVKSVDAIIAGERQAPAVYGLKEGGIGLVPFSLENPEDSQCEIMKNPEVIAKVKEFQDKIISGEITVEDPLFRQ